MRKTMFRWLIALAILLPCVVLNVLAAEERAITGTGTCGTNLTWILYEDGELVISGSGEMKNYAYRDASWLRDYQYVTEIRSVTIENGVTSVGDNAFGGCYSLSQVTLPDSVTTIGDFAFNNCTNLTSVTIPKSTLNIGEGAFCDGGLTKICVAEGNVNYCDIDGVLYNKEKSVLIQCPARKRGSFIVPDSVAVIGDRAFYHGYISSVIIPNGVTSIGKSAFYLCESIKEVTIPDSVRGIGDLAFAYCRSLTRIEFLGRVPANVGNDIFLSNSMLSVYYHEGTSGWPTTGIWQGYPLAMQSHTVVTVPAVAATCGETGLAEGSCCAVCGEMLVAQEVIPATGQHGYQLDEAVAPTCFISGLTAGASCPTCGYVHLAQEVVPATGHNEVVDVAVAATCTATGLTEGSHCSVCGEVLVAQEETPLTNHTPVTDPAVEATCAATGLTEGSHCDVCGEVLVTQQEVGKTTHTVVIDNPRDPTCTEVGYSGTGMHCDACGEVLLAQTEVPALGHDYIDHEAKEPTTESVGWEAYQTCSRCDYTTYKELPKLEVVVPAATRFKFSLEVVNTIVVDGQTVEICRWVWTPFEG